MEILIWSISNEAVKHLIQGKTTLQITLEELGSSSNRFSTGTSWAGINYLFSQLSTKSESKKFLVSGGVEVGETVVGLGQARVFSADEVKRIDKILAGLKFEILRGSVTLHELILKEVYPFTENDNSTRVFLDLKRGFELLKEEIARITSQHLGILIVPNAEIIQ